MNKMMIIGNVGAAPTSRSFQNSKVCNFSVATNETWTDAQGVRQQKTTWHNVAAWGRLGEVCQRYLDKGRKVFVEGRIDIREEELTLQDGRNIKRRFTTIVASSVEFLDSGKAAEPTAVQDDENPF